MFMRDIKIQNSTHQSSETNHNIAMWVRMSSGARAHSQTTHNVCMYACKYVCMYGWMDVCMYKGRLWLMTSY